MTKIFMTYWPFWWSGIALAALALGHFFFTRRMMSVSGAVGAMVDRLRSRPPDLDEDLTAEELAAAMREASEAAPAAQDVGDGAARRPASRTLAHVLFLGGLVLGGLAGGVAFDRFAVVSTLHGDALARFFGGGPTAWVVLLGGGVLVGFGTRMAGGCTSGHGLCGVSTLQKGSLLATAAFFGTGIVLSLLLTAVLS